MLQLIDLFLEQGFESTFASTAVKSERSVDLASLQIEEIAIQLNDASFDFFLKELAPDVVLFDRFITEEQFGWRVAETCPEALRILDTEDLHFLRKAREEAFKKDIPITKANLFTESAKRELASILRCDVSLIISEVEVKLLLETFKIPEGLLWYLPFLVAEEISEVQKKQHANFEERQHFIAVGNMKHAPNVASIKILKEHIWPTLQQKFPQAELHIYGAYVPQQLQEMHNPKDRFFIKGWVQDISEIMQKARVQVAPLPFGAGLKGKILDAFQNGLPTVTTSIGAEGMYERASKATIIADDWKDFSSQAVRLYKEKTAWLAVQNEGYSIVMNRFQKNRFAIPFAERISFLIENLKKHREQHFIGQILQYKTVQATKYMSKWIEEKGS
ncbi:glycosyltransferase [Rasiella sp. SM2506]|uniref:glycosyltransferase n=1 Tax=Rasiella sp. SM2506 TaxID=3423914 RepID=UPI003D7AD6B4